VEEIWGKTLYSVTQTYFQETELMFAKSVYTVVGSNRIASCIRIYV